MRPTLANPIWIALLALVAWGGTARLVHAEAGESKRIGIVNVSRVFKAYQKVADIQNKLKNQYKGQQDDMERRGKALKDSSDRLKAAQEEARPENVDLQRKLFVQFQDLQMKEFEINLDLRALREKIEKEKMDQMKQVLKEIRAAIREVGLGERFDVILRAPEYDEEGKPEVAMEDEAPDQAAPKSAGELVRRFRENPVLYFTTGVDITGKVIDKLNNDYKAAGGPNTK
jgi:outer membrane protein